MKHKKQTIRELLMMSQAHSKLTPIPSNTRITVRTIELSSLARALVTPMLLGCAFFARMADIKKVRGEGQEDPQFSI